MIFQLFQVCCPCCQSFLYISKPPPSRSPNWAKPFPLGPFSSILHTWPNHFHWYNFLPFFLNGQTISNGILISILLTMPNHLHWHPSLDLKILSTSKSVLISSFLALSLLVITWTRRRASHSSCFNFTFDSGDQGPGFASIHKNRSQYCSTSIDLDFSWHISIFQEREKKILICLLYSYIQSFIAASFTTPCSN